MNRHWVQEKRKAALVCVNSVYRLSHNSHLIAAHDFSTISTTYYLRL